MQLSPYLILGIVVAVHAIHTVFIEFLRQTVSPNTGAIIATIETMPLYLYVYYCVCVDIDRRLRHLN